ncbi:hypothetical protein ES705_21823 [subsurface metagenome]
MDDLRLEENFERVKEFLVGKEKVVSPKTEEEISKKFYDWYNTLLHGGRYKDHENRVKTVAEADCLVSNVSGVRDLEANSWIIFDCILIEKNRESGNFLFQLAPIALKINRKEVKAINRGRNAVIEAAILATRYVITADKREKEEIEKMMERYADVVAKCGGRSEKEAFGILHAKTLH